MLKVALVGCGKIADAHVEEIHKLGSARVVAVCDTELLMAEQLAVRFGIARYYADFDTMLREEQPDVVHITTPPQSHLELTLRALNAGSHVYVEKPVAMNSAEVLEMISAAEGLRRELTTGYWYNFEPPALEAMKLYRSRVLGEIVHVESVYGYDLSGEYGAAFLNNSNHWIYSLPGQLLYNVLDHIVNKIVQYIPDEQLGVHAIALAGDSAQSELRFMLTGAQATAFGMFSSRAKPAAHSVKLYGTKNAVCVDFASRTVTLDRAQVVPSALGRLFPPFVRSLDLLRAGAINSWRFAKSEFGYFTGMGTLIAAFYDSIRNGTAPPVPYGDMLRTSTLIEEIVAQVSPNAVVR